MNYAFSVARVQSPAYLLHDADGLGGSKLAGTAQNRFEVLTIHVFHGDELHAFSLAEVVDAHYILVGDLPGKNQFLLEPSQNLAIGCEFWPNDLERDKSVHLVVPRLVDGSHAAFPELLQYFVAPAQNFIEAQCRSRWPSNLEGRTIGTGRR